MPTPPVPDLPSRRQGADALLRRAGWRIYRRPAGHEAVWERNGELLPQSEALKVVTKEVARGKR